YCQRRCRRTGCLPGWQTVSGGR
ncbi:type IV secretion protein Rhs, partial [Escherichia coli]|nr:type IV secretion protein Rhs [Escherichia coli]